MHGRLPTAAALALLVGAGCYDVPTPDCGFTCGPAAACPADYTCSSTDNRCHRDGADPLLVCPAANPPTLPSPPYVLGTFPADGEPNVLLDVRPFIQFSEPVNGFSSSSTRMVDALTSLPIPIRVDFDVPTAAAVVVPLAPLAEGVRYRIDLSTAITDFEGQPLDAPFSFAFTTAVDVAPRVTSTYPAADQGDVPVDASLDAMFSEQMVGLQTGLELRDSGGAVVPGMVAVDISLDVVRFYPTTTLTPGMRYTAALSTALTDTTGNALVGAPYAWSFTTFQDVTPPAFSSSTPMAGDANVAVTSDVRVAFAEAVTNVDTASVLVSSGGTPIAGTVTTAFGGLQVVFTPAAALPAGALIDVTLTTAITDLAANPLLAPITFSFTTAP